MQRNIMTVSGGSKGANTVHGVRNFWNKNRKDIPIVALGALSAFLVAKYKLAWLVF